MKKLLSLLMGVILCISLFAPSVVAADTPRLLTGEVKTVSLINEEPVVTNRLSGVKKVLYGSGNGSGSYVVSCRDVLTENEKIVYDGVVSADFGLTSVAVMLLSYKISGGDFSQMDIWSVINALKFDCPTLFYVSSASSYSYAPRFYDMDSSGTLTENDIMYDVTLYFTVRNENYADQATAENYLSQVNDEIATQKPTFDACTTRYQLLKSFHDWLCGKITYSESGSGAFDMVGAVLDGSCVCQGYALTFKYLCDMYYIPCVVEVSDDHMWNGVLMDDGTWYFSDATWDDSYYPYYSPYFLVGSQTVIGSSTFSGSHVLDPDSITTKRNIPYGDSAFSNPAFLSGFSVTENCSADSAAKILYRSAFDYDERIYYNGLDCPLNKTASTFSLSNGEVWTAIFLGDATADGVCDENDYAFAVNAVLSDKALETNFERACDMNFDGVLDVLDIMLIELMWANGRDVTLS